MAVLSFFSHSSFNNRSHEVIKDTVETLYGTVTHEPVIVSLRVARGFFLVFWSRGIRDAFIVLVKVSTKLIGVMTLVVMSFVFHYILMQVE